MMMSALASSSAYWIAAGLIFAISSGEHSVHWLSFRCSCIRANKAAGANRRGRLATDSEHWAAVAQQRRYPRSRESAYFQLPRKVQFPATLSHPGEPSRSLARFQPFTRSSSHTNARLTSECSELASCLLSSFSVVIESFVLS